MSNSSIQVFLTTTGATSPVTFSSLGGASFVHPTTNEPLIVPDGQFDQADIIGNAQLQAAVTGGDITLTDADGNNIDVTDPTETSFVSLTLDENVSGEKRFQDPVFHQQGGIDIIELTSNGADDGQIRLRDNTGAGESLEITSRPTGAIINAQGTTRLLELSGIDHQVNIIGNTTNESFLIENSDNDPLLRVRGNNVIETDGRVVIDNQGIATTYELSVQGATDFTYIEILTGNSLTDQGAFFGMENYGAGPANQHFALYNWQGGPITFYTDTVASSGELRVQMNNDGTTDFFGEVTVETGTGSGLAPSANADELTLTGSGTNVGASIMAPAGGNSNIFLGETGNSAQAANIQHIGSVDELRIGVNGQSDSIRVSNGNIITEQRLEVRPENATEHGLTINHPSTAGDMQIGYFTDVGFNAYGFRRSDAGGVFHWANNATFPQIFLGDPANVTGSAFIDVDNNRPLNLNVLDTGAGTPAIVNVGSGGLNVGSLNATQPNLTLSTSTGGTDWKIFTGSPGNFDNWLRFGWVGSSNSNEAVLLPDGVWRTLNGVAGSPAHGFINASNYGMYLGGSNDLLCFSTAGTARLNIESNGTLNVSSTANYETLVTDDDDIPNRKWVLDNVPIKLYELFADQVDITIDADWAVSNGAVASVDTNNGALTVRRFDDTLEEGIGFLIQVPSTASEMTIRTKARAETAPGGAVVAVPKLYKRAIPDDGAIAAWTSPNALTNIDLPTNELYQYDETNATLGTWGLTAGELYQFELTRDATNGSDTLVGDLTLVAVEVEFK